MTVDQWGGRIYGVARTGLPQASGQRALRILEILAYGFNDYAVRESVRGRGPFVYPVTPDHGRLWLAEIGQRGGRATTPRKRRASRKNGRHQIRGIAALEEEKRIVKRSDR
jgi:hypothetical protein